MEENVFQQLLLSSISTDVTSLQVITEFRNSNYPDFIALLSKVMTNPMEPRISKIAITYLFNEVKNGTLFENSDLALNFLNFFANNVTHQFMATHIEENFKMMVSSILAILHVYVFKLNSDLSIPKYILVTYSTNPPLKKFMMNCICEIAIRDDDIGGFSLNDLVEILADRIDDLSLYVPRIHLLYSLAMSQPNEKIFHEIFAKLVLILPSFAIDDFLKSTSDFAEERGYFFSPHFDEVLYILWHDILLNPKIPDFSRDLAILCLVSIARGAPQMCLVSPNFVNGAIKSLIKVAAEITDDSPWEYDTNNLDPYQLALDALNMIFSSYDDPNTFTNIYNLFKAEFSEGKLEWQTVYAYYSTIAEIPGIGLTSVSGDTTFAQFFDEMVPFLNLNVHPRIRVAAYDVVRNMASHSLLYIHADPHTHIIPHLELAAINENELIPKQKAFMALDAFYSQILMPAYIDTFVKEYFLRFFPLLIDELMKGYEDINMYVIKCVGHLAVNAMSAFKQYLPTVVQILQNSLTTHNLTFRVEIISCFTLCIRTVENNNEIRAMSVFFLQNAIQLLGFVKNEKEIEDLYKSMEILISIIGKDVSQFLENIIPHILNESSKDLEIINSDTFHGSFAFTSIYNQIPSHSSAVKYYVLKSEVNEIVQNIRLISFIAASDDNAFSYIHQIVNICKKWIMSDFIIEKLIVASWDVFRSLVTKYQTSNLVDLIIFCFISTTNHYELSPSGQGGVYQSVFIALEVAFETKWCNEELLIGLLKVIPDLIDHVLSLKSSKIKELVQYSGNNYDIADRTLSFIDSAAYEVNRVVKAIYHINWQLTYQFFLESVIPKTQEYFSCFNNFQFFVPFMTTFLKYSHDFRKVKSFMQLLLSTIVSQNVPNPDIHLVCIEKLGNLFLLYPFNEEPELADQILDLLFKIFANTGVDNDHEIMYTDYICIAISKLMKANLHILNENKVVLIFVELSLAENPVDNDYFFSFMVLLIKNGMLVKHLGMEWVYLLLNQVVRFCELDQLEKETRNELCKCFYQLFITPEGKAALADLHESLTDSSKLTLKKIITDGEMLCRPGT